MPYLPTEELPRPIRDILSQYHIKQRHSQLKHGEGAFQIPFLSPFDASLVEELGVDTFHKTLPDLVISISKLEQLIRKTDLYETELQSIAQQFNISIENLHIHSNSVEKYAIINGCLNRVIVFNVNDYLGMSDHPWVQGGMQFSIERYGTGGLGSALLGGTSEPHIILQNMLSQFKGFNHPVIDSTLFPSGYAANEAMMMVIMPNYGHWLIDQKVHQSFRNGIRLSGVSNEIFSHNNIEDLQRKIEILRQQKSDNFIIGIVVESIYSMDGDLAPLDKLFELAKQYNCFLVVDEAHATGTIGVTGRGGIEYHCIDRYPDWVNYISIIGTFGKSLGTEGAFVTAHKSFIRYLSYFSDSKVFSTSKSIPTTLGTLMGLYVMQNITTNPLPLLRKNIKYLHHALKERRVNTGASVTHIIPILIDTPRSSQLKKYETGKTIFNYFLKNGIAIPLIVPPATEDFRLRISLSSAHTQSHLERLIQLIDDMPTELKDAIIRI